MANAPDIVARLVESGRRVHAAFQLPEPELARSYATGKWSVREILIHLTDSETVYFDRLRRLVADPAPLLWGFDQDRWHDQLRYEARSLTIAQGLFQATREAVIESARFFLPTHGSRTGVHSESGTMSLRDLVAKIVAHTEHHVEQVERATRSAD